MAGGAFAEWEAEQRAMCAAQIDRNNRLLRLAEHNGFVIELRDFAEHSYGGTHLWYVPRELRSIAGCMAAVVRL